MNFSERMSALTELADLYRYNFLVLGDVLVDEYIFGNAEKLSQEAPVPVVKEDEKKRKLGGAGNVACNIAGLGGNVKLYGASWNIWSDPYISCYSNIEFDKSFKDHGLTEFRNSRKLRVFADNHQIVRVDDDFKAQDYFLAYYDNLVFDIREGFYDALVISDYAKGMITYPILMELTRICHERNMPVFFDPHPDYAYVPNEGLTAVLPNKKEMGCIYDNLLGDNVSRVDSIEDQVRYVYSKKSPEYILCTLGKDGMILYDGDEMNRMDTDQVDVFDVSGAGDTVTAVFSCCITADLSPEISADLANKAAGTVINKIGTVPVEYSDIERVI